MVNKVNFMYILPHTKKMSQNEQASQSIQTNMTLVYTM